MGVLFDTLEERRLLSSVTVLNPGFEDPVLTDGNYTVNSIADWTTSISNSGTGVGVFNPTTSYYTNQAPQGSNIAYAYNAGGTSSISQVLSQNLEANTAYTLSVDVGRRLDMNAHPYRVQLLAGGSVLAEDNNSLNLSSGGWATSVVHFTAPAGHAKLGSPLEIRLLADPVSPVSDKQVNFDNVRLDAAPVAHSVVIPNFGFENPVLSDNNYTTNSVPGWTITPGSGSDGGVWNATASHFSPQAPEGSNIAYLETPSSSSTDAVLSQVLGENLAANTHYELKVEVGYPNTTAGKGYKIQLLAGGVVLAEDDNSMTLTQGGWKTASLTFNTSANPSQLGQAMEIRLIAKASSGTYKQVEFDNVRLDALPILPDPDPDPALVGWWRLNEGGGSTAFDTSDFNNDGVIGGRAQWSEGHEGDALYFDGYNDLVDLGNSSSLDLSGKVTLSAWIKPQATDGFRTIIAHGYRIAPNGEVTLRIAETEEGPVYVVGTWGDGIPHGADMPMPLTDIGQWVHITGLYDGTAWKIYRNGVLGFSRTDSVGALPVDASWSIGSSGGIGERMFQGSIDDVHLYNYGLSDTEVEDLYENSPVGLPAELTAMALSEISVGLVWPLETGDITGYTLQRAPHGGSFTTVDSLDPLTTSYIDTGLDEGTTYDYKLITSFASDPSVEETATVTTQLLAPTDLNLTGVGANSVDLAWNGHPAAGRWFEVWRSTDNKIYSLAGTTTSQAFSDTNLESGHRFYYKIRNCSANVSSDFSNVVNHFFDRSLTGPNWGFENPALSDNGWTTGDVPSWTINAASGVNVGVWNPPLDRFIPAATEGANVAYFETDGITDESSFSQVLGESLAAGRTYTLSVDVGYPTNAEPQGYKVQLLAGGVVVAEDNDILSLNGGAYRTSTVSYAVAPNDLHVGSALEIRLVGKANTDGHHRQVEFDNVRLNVADTVALTEVPEDPQNPPVELPANNSIAIPQNLTALAASVHQINLTWSYGGTADGFRIYQSIDGGDTWSLVKDLNGSARSTSIDGLNPVNRHYYYAAAYTGDGQSNPSNLATVALLATAPTGLTAQAQSTSSISLQWDAVDGAAEYTLQQSPDGLDWELLADSITGTTYTDGSMSEGMHRYYRVSAYNNNGAGSYSASTSATTAPAAPTNLSASAVSYGEINLHWTDNSSHETAHVVERRLSDDPQSAFSTIATLDANARYYSDVGLFAETAYAYRVRAAVSGNNSGYSNTSSATTLELEDPESQEEGEWVDTGTTASPSISSAAHHSFGTFNPGRYRVKHQSGAINFYKYSSEQWGVGGSFVSNGSGVGSIAVYPYNSASAASNAAQGQYLAFDHPGGAIEVYLVDDPYDDNSGGVTWGLERWSPAPDQEESDPIPMVDVTVSTSSTTEGDTENPLTFTFTRSGQYSSALTVYYTLSGTAEPGADYSPQS
ncbi:MAG: hypothetical protein IT446_01750, partial [Phycisphaerales bacterium]|nr:hypothetical protein [Phycisphaerales bacterium]